MLLYYIAARLFSCSRLVAKLPASTLLRGLRPECDTTTPPVPPSPAVLSCLVSCKSRSFETAEQRAQPENQTGGTLMEIRLKRSTRRFLLVSPNWHQVLRGAVSKPLYAETHAYRTVIPRPRALYGRGVQTSFARSLNGWYKSDRLEHYPDRLLNIPRLPIRSKTATAESSPRPSAAYQFTTKGVKVQDWDGKAAPASGVFFLCFGQISGTCICITFYLGHFATSRPAQLPSATIPGS